MCASELDCGAQASCVAGRCVARGATVAIDTARRVLLPPVDMAYVRSEGTGLPSEAVLGGSRDRDATLLLRFALSLPPEAMVLEAYLVLERAPGRDVDPGRLLLKTERVVEPWQGRSVTWASQPRVREIGAPVTPVVWSAGPLVRLDVRALVDRWRKRTGDDFGIAVAVEGRGGPPVPFVLSPTASSPGAWGGAGTEGHDEGIGGPAGAAASQPASPFEPHAALASSIADPRSELAGPRLELYVK
ncbi:MAG: hypothetical protein JOZ69_19255 [Myxococcales bacterium]|nr:hypothetical protein [Myxococcales bacterium]